MKKPLFIDYNIVDQRVSIEDQKQLENDCCVVLFKNMRIEITHNPNYGDSIQVRKIASTSRETDQLAILPNSTNSIIIK